MADKIKEPHAHDVLSGRGNFVNYHDGNEYFRKLVRKHKLEYVNCPKQQKGKFSKLIVDEIKGRNPPGRFLKQDRDTKLWYDIGEKKALDKTRQALREGAPELMNNGKGSSSNDETTGADTTFNKPPIDQQHMSHGELSILQQSIMSIGNDSFHQSGGMMGHNPYNMQGIGLSPNVLSSPMYASPGGGSNNKDNGRLGNRTGGIDLSQIIPPPEVHQNEQNLLQQQRKEQEQQLQQLKYLQQQQRQQQEQEQQQQQQQRQSRQSHFTSQQEQEIIRNATAVMGNDFQKPQQQQQNHTKMHMDQLRINKLKEKRKLLEQQILHQRQLEILELKRLQNQQKLNEYQQQSEQQQHPTSSEMRGALQNRLGAVYAGTEAFLEPTPMPGSEQKQMLPPSSLQSNGTSSSLDITADLAGGADDHNTVKDRRSGLVRENSLKMESIFENPGAPAATTTNPKKNYNMSASGMSMSGTSLSLGFDEESELSALFDTSMKIEGAVARGYATTLNDRGDGNTPRSPKPIRSRDRNSSSVSGNLLGNTALLGMSLASIGAEKSNSSMSCDSSLSRLFDDTGTPSK